MFYRIFYTSWPQLLEGGRGGFGVAARHKQIPALVVHAAEAVSQFAPLRGAAIHRVIYAYRTESTPSGRWHILSRIEDSGSDYTGRTNYLAQHLVTDDNTARLLAAQRITPARVMSEEGAWPGFDKCVGFIEGPAWAPSSGPGSGGYWAGMFADKNPDRRFLLAAASARVTFVYPSGWSDGESAKFILGLYDEAASCAEPDCRPSCGWGTTFTTYLEPTDKPQDFDWIGLPENSPLLPKLLEAKNRIKIDQHSPVPVRPLWGAPPRKPGDDTKTTRQPEALGVPQTVGNIARVPQQPPIFPEDRGRPFPPEPIKKPISPWKKWRTPVLVAAAAIVAFLAFGSVMLFLSPAPPKISFTKTKLEAYTGKPFELRPLIKTEPEGVEVKLSPGSLIAAGKHQVTASVESTWLRPGSNITTTIEIPQAKVEITFDSASLKQDYASARNNGAKPITSPASDNGIPLQPEVTFKLLGSQDAPQERESKLLQFSPGTKYEVIAKIDGNYIGKASAILEILPNETGAVKSQARTPLPVGNDAGTEFFLADRSKMVGLLKEKMPQDGKLEVMRLDDGQSKRFEVERTKGTLVGVNNTWDEVFEMEAGCPIKKKNCVIKDQADAAKIIADLDGPLAYIVSGQEGIPAFVALELVNGDNKSALDAFFAGAFVDASKGSPHLCLIVKESGRVIDLSQVERPPFDGSRFQLHITEKSDSANPLKITLADSGELSLNRAIDALKDELARAAQAKQDADQAAQAGPKDYFSRAKRVLLDPLKKKVENKQAGELATRLLERMDQISPSAAATDNGEMSKQVQAICDLVSGVFKILETAPQNSGDSTDAGDASDLVALSKDRAKDKDGKKKPAPGSESLQSIYDDSLLTWEELGDRILEKDKNVPAAVNRAKEWIKGRSKDVSKNTNSKTRERAKDVNVVLDSLIPGLSSVVSVPAEEMDKPKPVIPSVKEQNAQAKLDFLKAIGTKQAQGEQGELFIVQETQTGNFGAAPSKKQYLLWPSVSLAPRLTPSAQ